MTPLQIALAAWAEALEHARSDDRTFRVFLDIVARRLAAEFGHQLEGGRR